MQLQLLGATPCLSIYHDARYNGLFLDWTGELTLPAVQDACVAVAQCYLQQTYSRVLNSNLQVTEVSEVVTTWLGTEFLPYMTVAGVKQVAWISAPSLPGHNLVQTIREQVPGLSMSLFDNAEEAIAWLQQPTSAQPESYLFPQRQTITQVRLAQGVQVIKQEAQLIRQEVQQLQQKVSRKPMTSTRA